MLISVFKIVSQDFEGRITYLASTKVGLKNKFTNDSLNKKGKIISKNQFDKIYKNSKDLKVVLEFNSLISVYKVTNHLSIYDKEKFNLTQILSGYKAEYYVKRNILNYESYIYECELFDECFLIENKIPQWELSQESKIIGGFLCYKAIIKNTKSNKILAESWYTPKIPFQYGVMNYFGLPGVILEISIDAINIKAIKVELNPLEKIIIDEPKNIKKLTYEEYEKMKKTTYSMLNKK